MEISTAEKILSKMDKETFWRFSNELFKTNYTDFKEIKDSVIPISCGLEVTGIGHCYSSVFILDYFPQQIFTDLSKIQLNLIELEKSLNLLEEKLFSRPISPDFRSPFEYPQHNHAWSIAQLERIYLIGNINGFENDDYHQYIHSQYDKVFEQIFAQTPIEFGNLNTYFAEEPDIILKELEKFLLDVPDGMVIEMTKDSISVNEFSLQDITESGIT